MLKEFKGTREQWNKIISNFDFFDYLSLYEWGEFKKRQGWQLKRYTLSRDNKTVYAFQTFYKKIFFIKLVWIPGGILGKIDSNLNLLVSNLKVVNFLSLLMEPKKSAAPNFPRLIKNCSIKILLLLNFIRDSKDFIKL